MSAAKHTPGRLTCDADDLVDDEALVISLSSADGRNVAGVNGFTAVEHEPGVWGAGLVGDIETVRANARRLAACWNACEQLSTEQLEQVPGLPLAMVAHHELVAQRDALLEALRANHQWHLDHDDHDGYPGSELETQNLAAIAKATGQEGGAA